MAVRPARPLGMACAIALCPALAGCPSSPYPEARVELAAPGPAHPPAETRDGVLRFSVAAMQSPQHTFDAYPRILDRIGKALGTRVELVQRRTYAEVNELLVAGKVDAAIVCTGGYLELEREHPGSIELLAAPVVGGRSTYQSFIIVPADSPAARLADLAGKRFAYTDELSLSGRLYVLHALRSAKKDPSSFFGAVQLTGSHDRSIDAVTRHVVDGAAVDSLVLETLLRLRPEVAAGVRIVERSPLFGAAPVVASTRLPAERRAALRQAFLSLGKDPESASALRAIGLDGYAVAAPGLYDSAARVVAAR